MTDTSSLRRTWRPISEPYYVDVFGTMPPIPKERLATGRCWRPASIWPARRRARNALFSDVFDNKTAQLFVAVIMLGDSSPA